jgi:hypothetical protein
MRPTILVVLSALGALAPARAPAQTRWDDIHAGLLAEPVSTCVGCHEEAARLHASHPVDVEYDRAQQRAGSGLRPRAEVERRGVALPEAKVHCWSCHAAGSRWRFHLFLPAGAVPRLRVVPGVEGTNESNGATPPPGSDVSPKPLCLACHGLD